MKYLITGLILCVCTCTIQAQYIFTARIINKESREPLPGATLKWLQGNRSAVADSAGIVSMHEIAGGKQDFLITHVGFEEKHLTLALPLILGDIVIEMEDAGGHEDEQEVIVTATRSSRTIANTPTRTEVISGEELTEKGNMKPGDIRMLLNESTGIQTQQTSATSYNSGIRIQGLDGRYTQILRDGYPLYAGFSGGLSLLQIAPLDLKQVEVIKGSASTLYSGGAIAGLVNLVSKTPVGESVFDFLINGTSAGGLDLSGFYSEKYGTLGLTVFASRNSNKAFADIGLTAIPKFERYSINPRLFFYGKNTTADIGISYVTEDRTGGSMDYIKNGGSGFFEKNNTDRITTQLGITHHLNEHSYLQFKNSYSRFDRSIAIPAYRFDALQQSSFSEFTLNQQGEAADWIVGANLLTDQLREKQLNSDPLRNYSYNTVGLFIQNTWTISSLFTLETGLRGDYVNEYGFELLPRISGMFKLSPKVTTRLGGGFGYKSPTIFTEEAERRQFQHILPVNINATRNERSAGGNWDINYRTQFGEIGFAFNHLFFYTRLNRPLVLTAAPGGAMQFENSTGYLDTKGMETNIRFSYGHFKLFIGYTYTDANTHFSDKQWLPLTARHRLNNVLMYEIEDKLKIGLEAYYYSPQKRSDGSMGKSYWITGLMAEKLWEKFSVFVNFENFSNTRQTRFDTIFTGTINNPVFRDIYAPVDGFVVNGGVKIRM
jgi:iron complex outermembrane receptor protein